MFLKVEPASLRNQRPCEGCSDTRAKGQGVIRLKFAHLPRSLCVSLSLRFALCHVCVVTNTQTSTTHTYTERGERGTNNKEKKKKRFESTLIKPYLGVAPVAQGDREK